MGSRSTDALGGVHVPSVKFLLFPRTGLGIKACFLFVRFEFKIFAFTVPNTQERLDAARDTARFQFANEVFENF